jgi:predicted deacetylase
MTAVAASRFVSVKMMTQTPSAITLPRRLVTSIHDVSPGHEDAIDRLEAQIMRHGIRKFAMLVVPNFWGEAPIMRGTPFATRLRQRADRGVEMFLHGSEHRDQLPHPGWLERWKATWMTAGEGEFLGMSSGAAEGRIAAGRALIEDIIGRPVAGFVAPAWLYGAGALDALQASDIGILEDHWRIWDAGSGRTLARSPVITWATRTPARKATSLAAAAVVRTLPGPRVMRLAVHPADVTSPRVRRSISKTIDALRRHRIVSSYADLAADARCPC